MQPLSRSPAVRSRFKRHQRGQSVVEFAIVLPLLLVILLGMVEVGLFITSKVGLGAASRQGARLAAVLGGGNQYTPPPPDTSTSNYDNQIVQAVLRVSSNLAFAQVLEIDIYNPTTNSDGSYDAVADLADEYAGDGTPLLKQTFPLSLRLQRVPLESSIGVRVLWQYNPPSRFVPIPTGINSEYTVFKALAVP